MAGSGGSMAGSGGSTVGGSAGAGGAGTGGGDAAACNECALTQFNGSGTVCWDLLQACLLDEGCRTWFNCSQSCQADDFDVSCFEACDAAASAAQDAYEPVAGCLCLSCAEPCAPRCN